MDMAIAIPSLSSNSDWSLLKNKLSTGLEQIGIGGGSRSVRIAVVTYKGTVCSSILIYSRASEQRAVIMLKDSRHLVAAVVLW